MACSKEEIERKRRAALQKLQKFLTPAKFYPNQTSLVAAGTFQAGRIKTFNSDSQKSFHPYAKPNSGHKVENSIPVTKSVNGTVYLSSEQRFEVILQTKSPLSSFLQLIEVFKTIPSRSFDSEKKLWTFSLFDYEGLMSKVDPLAPYVVLERLPPSVLQILRENYKEPSDAELSQVEATLRHKLMPFQEDGVRFAISRGGRCMIADDMGLGKSFQALAVASYYRHNWPLLIVTTSSTSEIWQSKIRELLPSVPTMNVVILTDPKDAQRVANTQTEVVIVSYKIITIYKELLKNKNFGFVIIDESHYLKSFATHYTTALNGLVKRAPRLVLLSGTPALSRPNELFTQLSLIEPRFMPSFTEYGKRYCNGKKTNYGWDMTGQSNLEELQVILQKRFLIRRTKEQVLTKLGEKTRVLDTRTDIRVRAHQRQEALAVVIAETVLLNQLIFNKQGAALSQAAEYFRRCGARRQSALVTYCVETARVKIPAVCKYIRQVVRESTEKFLVFAHHRSVIDAICNELDEAGVPYVCIVDRTPTNTRAHLVDKFQHGLSRCCVLSMTAAISGVTLTAAALVLFAELHWNLEYLTQAEAIAHRIGQQGTLRVKYLLAQGTADDAMWQMLLNKQNVLNDVGLSNDSLEGPIMKHQFQETITQYLAPQRMQKNKHDYIPGTNESQKEETRNFSNVNYGLSSKTVTNNNTGDCVSSNSDNISTRFNCFSKTIETKLNEQFDMSKDFEKSFYKKDEDDELLANLDLNDLGQ